MKKCTQCKVEKKDGEFYKQKTAKDGLQSVCKVCDVENSRKWNVSNKERRDKLHRKWVQDNRDNRSVTNAKYYAAKVAAKCDCCTPTEIKAYRDSCPPGHEVDHIQALSVGGKHCLRNMQIIPAELNKMKGTQNIIYLF